MENSAAIVYCPPIRLQTFHRPITAMPQIVVAPKHRQYHAFRSSLGNCQMLSRRAVTAALRHSIPFPVLLPLQPERAVRRNGRPCAIVKHHLDAFQIAGIPQMGCHLRSHSFPLLCGSGARCHSAALQLPRKLGCFPSALFSQAFLAAAVRPKTFAALPSSPFLPLLPAAAHSV